MKRWNMIHKIKSLYDNGNGLSENQIAMELGISRNTVRKYIKMPESDIAKQKADTDRAKKLDEYRIFIIHLLETYPGLSAVKVLRKLKAKVELLDVSERSVRRYIQGLKNERCFKQPRYYEPVIDMVPGVQCQVDGGELRKVMIGGVETTVYFMVFVLSYSRLMHVSVSAKPIDTQALIYQHDAAFRYFGGMPQECVYDQTKLVVISEIFRELNLNQRFFHYATAAGLNIRVCEGYDPESKGKVESGVKYVKHNALYGETFKDWQHLESYMSEWLDSIANQRLHGTTGQQPYVHYHRDEKAKMLSYLTPSCLQSKEESPETRKVDKMGLISWDSNKYSVPMAYQSSRVGVSVNAGQLLIHDVSSSAVIAEHTISLEKSRIIKNTNHYRDLNQYIEGLEVEIKELLGSVNGEHLCTLLKKTSPKIYKDQLAAVKKIISTHTKKHSCVEPQLLERILTTPRLTATQLRDMLAAYQQYSERLQECKSDNMVQGNASTELDIYARLNVRPGGQGESNVVH